MSAVKWPEKLQKVDLSGTNVSGALSLQLIRMGQEKKHGGTGLQYSGPSLELPRDLSAYDLAVMDLKQFAPKGDIDEVSWPKALEELDLRKCANITAPLECPRDKAGALHYSSKEACDELKSWVKRLRPSVMSFAKTPCAGALTSAV